MIILLVFFVANVFCDLKLEKELQVVLDTKDVKASPYYKDKVLSIPISNAAGKELMEHWTNQAMSGLISAIATRRLPLVEKYDVKKHEKCSDKATDLKTHAKCLVELENDGLQNRWLKRKKYFNKKMQKKISKSAEKTRKRKRISKKSKSEEEKWVGSFRTRAKREIKVRNSASYELKTKYDGTPFGQITRSLSNTVKAFKKKDKVTKWQEVIERIKGESEQMKMKKKAESIAKRRFDVFRNAARLKNVTSSEERRRDSIRRKQQNGHFAEMEKYIEDDQLKEMFHERTQNLTEEEKLMLLPQKFVRDLVEMGLKMSGKNTSDFASKNVKLLSPKFFSVVPEDPAASEDTVDVFSPSLFALHNDGQGFEKNASFKSLLGNGLDERDSQDFLDLLIEATLVSDAVEEAEDTLIKEQRKKDQAMGLGPDGQPLYFTKENVTERFPEQAKKIELFEQLDKTYSKEQLKDMNQTGYTIMTPKQQKLVYGKQSPFKNAKLLNTMKKLTPAQIHREIHNNIKDLAAQRLKFEVRQKDIILSPIVGTPIINNPALASQALILSPAVFVPLIQSPAVFGTVILSPWLFVPVILSPRVLSPVILDPFMFVPIVLSPLALVPVILSPGVMNPFVLSPLVLCPFILSPQVMTPLILSPFALTPLILNPLALSPLVLSPFVLSPQIMSPQFVTGIILSPYALSPAIESNGKFVTVFASPSWLS